MQIVFFSIYKTSSLLNMFTFLSLILSFYLLLIFNSSVYFLFFFREYNIGFSLFFFVSLTLIFLAIN